MKEVTAENNNRDVIRMETEITNIKDLLLEVRDDIKNLNQTYIPRNETNVMFHQRDLAIQDIKKEVTELKAELKDSKRNIPNWISSIVAIVAVIVAFFK